MRLGVLFAASLASHVEASDFSLALPVDCTLGEDCYIQNYVDRDSGEGYEDFACGHLSYDTHKGTDIAVPTHVDALRPVAILASAAGEVKALRDGEPDFLLQSMADFEPGKECGNGLLIDHGNGWTTQYCHLMRGSVSVAVGDIVETGAVLGAMGMSGKTQFPHVHLTVRHNGDVVDPFDVNKTATCENTDVAQLWDAPIAYEPTGFLGVGIASKIPDYEAVRWGQATIDALPKKPEAIVLWAFFFGGRVGQELHFSIVGPDGVFFENTHVIEKSQAQSMRAMGRRIRAAGATPGTYRGTVVLSQNGAEIDRIETQINLPG